jgi:protein-arginine deiminase
VTQIKIQVVADVNRDGYVDFESDEPGKRVPSLFDKYGVAMVPNMVNSTVLNGHIFIVAPNGPVVDGQDQLEKEMRRLLSDLPLTPHFLDAQIYHRRGGEVHCATNVRREGFTKAWWDVR